MHGLGQVSYHTVRIARFAWIVAFLGAQAGLFYHMSNLIQLFIDRPIQETTTILHKPTRFPDVTVCNLDPLSRSNLEAIMNNENSSVAKYNTRINQMYEDKTISANQLSKFRSHIPELLSNINEHEAIAVGHQLKDFILRCTFLGQPCNWTDQWTRLQNPLFYNCYTFDPGELGATTVGTGPELGLSLILYLEATNGTNVKAQYNKVSVINRIASLNKGSIQQSWFEETCKPVISK